MFSMRRASSSRRLSGAGFFFEHGFRICFCVHEDTIQKNFGAQRNRFAASGTRIHDPIDPVVRHFSKRYFSERPQFGWVPQPRQTGSSPVFDGVKQEVFVARGQIPRTNRYRPPEFTPYGPYRLLFAGRWIPSPQIYRDVGASVPQGRSIFVGQYSRDNQRTSLRGAFR
jgi:hypothetical protein